MEYAVPPDFVHMHTLCDGIHRPADNVAGVSGLSPLPLGSDLGRLCRGLAPTVRSLCALRPAYWSPSLSLCQYNTAAGICQAVYVNLLYY